MGLVHVMYGLSQAPGYRLKVKSEPSESSPELHCSEWPQIHFSCPVHCKMTTAPFQSPAPFQQVAARLWRQVDLLFNCCQYFTFVWQLAVAFDFSLAGFHLRVPSFLRGVHQEICLIPSLPRVGTRYVLRTKKGGLFSHYVFLTWIFDNKQLKK